MEDEIIIDNIDDDLKRFFQDFSCKTVMYDPLDRDIPPEQVRLEMPTEGEDDMSEVWTIKRDNLLKIIDLMQGVPG